VVAESGSWLAGLSTVDSVDCGTLDSECTPAPDLPDRGAARGVAVVLPRGHRGLLGSRLLLVLLVGRALLGFATRHRNRAALCAALSPGYLRASSADVGMPSAAGDGAYRRVRAIAGSVFESGLPRYATGADRRASRTAGFLEALAVPHAVR